MQCSHALGFRKPFAGAALASSSSGRHAYRTAPRLLVTMRTKEAGVGLFGTKAGMTQIFTKEGLALPATVIALEEGNIVTQVCWWMVVRRPPGCSDGEAASHSLTPQQSMHVETGVKEAQRCSMAVSRLGKALAARRPLGRGLAGRTVRGAVLAYRSVGSFPRPRRSWVYADQDLSDGRLRGGASGVSGGQGNEDHQARAGPPEEVEPRAAAAPARVQGACSRSCS